MLDKLCLQWNDFKDNIISVFGRLREDKEFTDVTLACEDGQQMQAHKVILAASSPFFEKILHRSKHPHPLIYLKGFQSKHFVSILNFLYFGEANINQEDLDPFLAIAEDIELKGLTGQTSKDPLEEKEKPTDFERVTKSQESCTESVNRKKDLIKNVESMTLPKSLAIPNQFGANMQELDEKVKSMMEKGLNMIPKGKHSNGNPKQASSYICKVCGKKDTFIHIRDHIEGKHVEGLSLPCDFCDKTFSSRTA